MLLTGFLALAAFVAGAQNALAGGGSFITFPALLFAGLDPRAANVTSTIALFPSQITTGIAGRHLMQSTAGLSVAAFIILSLAGGGLGAALLLATPVAFFVHLVPFLVLFATCVFAWGSFAKKPRPPSAVPKLPGWGAATLQFFIAVYGGYFGAGIGFLMLAVLTASGLALRNAGAMKNSLAAVINVSAVLIFALQAKVNWQIVGVVAVSAVVGGQLGVFLLKRVNETILRIIIVVIGFVLTIGLFTRQ